MMTSPNRYPSSTLLHFLRNKVIIIIIIIIIIIVVIMSLHHGWEMVMMTT